MDGAPAAPDDTVSTTVTIDTNPEAAAAPPTMEQQRFLDAVAERESSGGAFDPGIAQYLVGLGSAYQQAGRHGRVGDVSHPGERGGRRGRRLRHRRGHGHRHGSTR